jgi:plasmid stabilization system protein ParE
MIIKWTLQAEKDYISILTYIQSEFSSKEVKKFSNKIQKVLLLLTKTPLMFPFSEKRGVNRCVISKQTTIYYRCKKGHIELIRFWDNRQNPKKKKI